MLLLIVGIATTALLLASVYLFKKVEQEREPGQISIEDLNGLSFSNPPVIVSQVKGGEVQQTLCYLSSYDTVLGAAVVEVDVRDRLLSRLHPDRTITVNT